MESSYTADCPVDPAPLQRSYREGYLSGKAERPREIRVVHEREDDGWQCLEHFGEKTCGYDCKEAYGKVDRDDIIDPLPCRDMGKGLAWELLLP